MRRAASSGVEHVGSRVVVGAVMRVGKAAHAVAGLDVEALRKLKFSRSKAEYLIAAAKAVVSGEIPIANLRNLSARHAARLLERIRGIGPWTIQYAFLRGFGFAERSDRALQLRGKRAAEHFFARAEAGYSRIVW